MISHDADSVRGLAINLANDHFTAQLVAGLRARQTRPILLKGASVRRMLYGTAEDRVSNDIDLLVAPHEITAVEAALPDLGFRFLAVDTLGVGRAHDRVWAHDSTGLLLELHTSISGIGAPPSTVWQALSAATEVMEIEGEKVEILDEVARTFHIALNGAHHGRQNAKTVRDLEQAVTLILQPTWEGAAALATHLDALPAFAAGVRLDSRGDALLESLGIDAAPDSMAALRAETAPPLAQGFGWLMELPSTRARVRFVAQTLAPPRGYMELWWPPARRGPLWLVVAYCWRPLWIAARLVPAARAWRRASRSSRD